MGLRSKFVDNLHGACAKMKRFAILGAVVAFGSASPAYAAWDISRGDDYCAVSGEYADDGNTLITLAQYGDDVFTLFVANDNWTIVTGRDYPLMYAFDDEILSGEATGYSIDSEKGFRVGGGKDLAALFAKSARLAVLKDENTVALLVRLNGSAAATDRLRNCWSVVRAELAQKKATEDALAAKRKIIPADPFFDPNEALPIGNAGRWATNDDYPAAAMRENREGTTRFRVSIADNGTVASCEILETSGHADLDAETCKLLTRRARFNAAPNGHPLRYYENNVRWQIPR